MNSRDTIEIVPWLKCCNSCQGPGKCKSKRGAGHWSRLAKTIKTNQFDPKRHKEIHS